MNHFRPVGCSSFHSTVPDHAHFVCESLDAAVRLASEPPLADLIEIIWIVGGVQIYKVTDSREAMSDTRPQTWIRFCSMELRRLSLVNIV